MANLDEILVAMKTNDMVVAATELPERIGNFGKLFAGALGKTSGKLIDIYTQMFSELSAGKSADEVKKAIRRRINQESKMEFKAPFSAQKVARNCGLVAIRDSGFFDAEVELYERLRQDIGEGDLLQDARAAAATHPETYSQLLEAKQQAVYDFGVLMGTVSDRDRFKEITGTMPDKMAKFFGIVSRRHSGKIISWPLPFKRFSNSIRQGLVFDRLSYELQQGLGRDFGFVNPEERKDKLAEIVDKAPKFDSSANPIKRWQAISAATTAMVYLANMGPQLAKVQQMGFSEANPCLAATLIGATVASLCGQNVNTNNVSEYSLTVYSTLTTT